MATHLQAKMSIITILIVNLLLATVKGAPIIWEDYDPEMEDITTIVTPSLETVVYQLPDPGTPAIPHYGFPVATVTTGTVLLLGIILGIVYCLIYKKNTKETMTRETTNQRADHTDDPDEIKVTMPEETPKKAKINITKADDHIDEPDEIKVTMPEESPKKAMNIMKPEEHHEEAKKPGSYDICHSSFQQLMAAIIAYGSSNHTSRSDKPLSARTIPSGPDHGCQCCIARGHEELYTPENQTTAGEHLGEAKKVGGYGISQPSSKQLTASGMAKASVLPSVREPPPSDLGHDCECCIALGREQLYTPK
ncbi:uncharacterized protein [Eleutherodactylus coqui]|uniref:uncharacterized protein n=2 Tax=Eleutherodactylus coqui TaxID=57060 RepID=UPI0034625F57